jgi:hypothetical protein
VDHTDRCPVEDAVTKLSGTFTISSDALNTLMDGLAPLYDSLLASPHVGDHPGARVTRADAVLQFTAHAVEHVTDLFGNDLADHVQQVVLARYGVDLLTTAKARVVAELREGFTRFLDELVRGSGPGDN